MVIKAKIRAYMLEKIYATFRKGDANFYIKLQFNIT